MICGIDLAGSKNNPTGICILNEREMLLTVYEDGEILSLILECAPSLVAIDAPLSFHGDHFRDCDLELRKEYPILPLTFRGMQSLTQRGISLKSKILCPVIEVYPYAARKVLSIDKISDLTKYISVSPSTTHELDAAAAALTGKCFLEGRYKAYGKKDTIIVPV